MRSFDPFVSVYNVYDKSQHGGHENFNGDSSVATKRQKSHADSLENQTTFGLKLKILRLKHRMSLEDVAEALRNASVDVTHTTIDRWERGCSLPRLDAGLAISRLLGVTLEYLANDETEKLPTRTGMTEEYDRVWDHVMRLGVDEAERRLDRRYEDLGEKGQTASLPHRRDGHH